MLQPSEHPLYEFEGFRLDPLRRLLFAGDGRRIPLKPKVFSTLLCLVRNRGEVLDKHRLMRAVWGRAIVDENGLNQHISALRRALGEHPGDNRFIVTVPGEGYLFVADVTAVQSLASAGPSRRPPTLTVTTPAPREMALSRTFDLPPERLFEAWTKPELLALWYGGPDSSMVLCEVDFRVGGFWRCVTVRHDGTESRRCGVYVEIATPRRLVYTEASEGASSGETLDTVEFVRVQRHSAVNIVVRFESQAERDAALRAGRNRDTAAALARLAELCADGPIAG